MQNLRTIIVTGSNKGIGYGIVENLARKQGWDIIMACRNLELAIKSRLQILKKFPNASISVEELDVSKSESIKSFVDRVKQKYKKVDVLMNNAGMAFHGDAFDSNVVKTTFKTNFYGTIEISEAILPLIVDNGKIITLGSMAGKVSRLPSEQLQKRFMKENLTKQQLFDLMKQFETAVQQNNYEEKGWRKNSYGTSKIGINVFARVLSKYAEVVNRKIQVYVCCPGYVATDMTSHKGILTVQEGVKTPVFLAQLPFEVNQKYQGQFFERSALSSLL